MFPWPFYPTASEERQLIGDGYTTTNFAFLTACRSMHGHHRRTHPLDALLPIVNGRFEATQNLQLPQKRELVEFLIAHRTHKCLPRLNLHSRRHSG
jgi:hypothetical protein